MESLQKAKESLELKRSQCLDVIKAETEANPVLKKAMKDLQSIDKALAIANGEIKKAEDLENAKAEASKREKALKEAVDAVIDLIDKDEIDDDKIDKIASDKGVDIDDLKEAVDEYLDEED